jgi:hypothetical protein
MIAFWQYIWHFPPHPGVCVVIVGFVAAVMTLRSPDHQFGRWQKFGLFVLLGVLSFGEMYALKTDRDEYETQHSTEFGLQMTKLADLFAQDISLKAQGEKLGHTVADTSYLAVVKQHQQLRMDIGKFNGQISKLALMHGQHLSAVYQRYGHNPGNTATPEAKTKNAADRVEALKKENDRFGDEYNKVLLPQLERLIQRILVATGRTDEAQKGHLAERYGLTDPSSGIQRASTFLSDLSSTMQP